MSTSKDNINLVLYNIENYKKTINKPLQEILSKITDVIIEFMNFISEKITMRKKSYYVFILERGIETLMHVFSVIFFYTKNLDLTIYHTQKAYYFYIEFIEQISDDNITFLKLSSRDAILFVYKKTIFDINSEYKKTICKLTIEEEEIFEIIKIYIQIYKKIIHYFIGHNEFLYNIKKEKINDFCIKIKSLNNILIKGKLKLYYIKCIYMYIQLLVNSHNSHRDNQIKINDFCNNFEFFMTNIQNKKTLEDINIINNKIQYCDVNKYLDEYDIASLHNYIFVNN